MQMFFSIAWFDLSPHPIYLPSPSVPARRTGRCSGGIHCLHLQLGYYCVVFLRLGDSAQVCMMQCRDVLVELIGNPLPTYLSCFKRFFYLFLQCLWQVSGIIILLFY